MDLSTALYRSSLLSIDGVDLLPSSQCICFAFRLSCPGPLVEQEIHPLPGTIIS
jgi:hypothetical protein